MVSAVVLAAGQSKRMGTKKELLRICGRPMMQMVVETLLESAVDEVIVVLGHRADEVGSTLSEYSDPRLELIGNPEYREGMGTSLAHGVRACSWGTNAIVVALGDVPFVTPELVDALIKAHAAGAGIVVPVFAGRRGHPVILDSSYREALEELKGDAGARALLDEEKDAVALVELRDDGFLVDIDEREDYEAVKEGIGPR
jgi:molybdenum cofactor cytidylyltransferase